jgi:glycosyltransferase involved in cell wall biosynthesis
MRIAIVHEWLDTWAGSEAVLALLLELFPKADLYTVVDFLAEEDRKRFAGRHIRTSFIQKIPLARSHFRKFFFLMPLAVERFDLSEYELVISNSHAVAKGVRTGPEQLHICICYSPARYAWDSRQTYLATAGLTRGPLFWLANSALERFRIWDFQAASRVDRFVAISRYIAERIERCYRRTAEVIYPPVDIARYAHQKTDLPRSSFYLTVSRLVPYKRIDLIVQAFATLPDRELIVVGEGPEMARIAALAGANVRLAGRLSDDERDKLLASARAFIFAAEEDFGIAPVEAQACGTPVIALSRGGAIETIRGLNEAEPTGVFFGEQTVASIVSAVKTFEQSAHRITSAACRSNARRFAADVFRRRFADLVEASLAEFRARRAA